MAEKIPLGQALSSGTGLAVSKARLTDKQRIDVLEQQCAHMQKMIQKLMNEAKGSGDSNAYDNLNKDGIPVGLECRGTTEKQPFLLFLTVEADGYRIGNTKYASLSAAAEAVSRVRRSGWTFWKLSNGTTLKDAFRKR